MVKNKNGQKSKWSKIKMVKNGQKSKWSKIKNGQKVKNGQK